MTYWLREENKYVNHEANTLNETLKKYGSSINSLLVKHTFIAIKINSVMIKVTQNCEIVV